MSRTTALLPALALLLFAQACLPADLVADGRAVLREALAPDDERLVVEVVTAAETKAGLDEVHMLPRADDMPLAIAAEDAQRSALSQDNDKLLWKVRQLNEQNAALGNELARAEQSQALLRDQVGQTRALEAENAAMARQLQVMERDLDAAQRQLAVLRADNDRLQQRVQATRNLRDQVASLQTENARLQQRLRGQDQGAALRAQLAAVEQALAVANADNARLQAQVDRLKDRVQAGGGGQVAVDTRPGPGGAPGRPGR